MHKVKLIRYNKRKLSYLPSKKVFLSIIFLLIITVGFLWFVGKKERQKKERESKEYYLSIIEQNEKMTNLVKDSLGENGQMQNIDISTLVVNKDSNSFETNTPTSTETLRNYGISLRKAFGPFAQNRANDSSLLLAIIEKKQEKNIDHLYQTKTMFDNLSFELSQIIVPEIFAQAHNQLITSAKQASILLSNMAQILNEPVLALESAQLYLKALSSLYKLTDGFNLYFQEKNILTEQEKILFLINLE